jgi:hypothetical protein
MSLTSQSSKFWRKKKVVRRRIWTRGYLYHKQPPNHFGQFAYPLTYSTTYQFSVNFVMSFSELVGQLFELFFCAKPSPHRGLSNDTTRYTDRVISSKFTLVKKIPLLFCELLIDLFKIFRKKNAFSENFPHNQSCRAKNLRIAIGSCFFARMHGSRVIREKRYREISSELSSVFPGEKCIFRKFSTEPKL